MSIRPVAIAATVGIAAMLSGCVSTTTASSSTDGTGSPAIAASTTLGVVACEPDGLCVAAGSNPTATTDGLSMEVSSGGRGRWQSVAVPAVTGVTLSAAACWASGCLVGGSGPNGVVTLLVNPATRRSSATATHPGGSGIDALDCVGAGHCVTVVATSMGTAVFVTTDSGAAWHQAPSLPASLAVATSLSCATTLACVVAGTGVQGALLASTTDGGAQWRLDARPSAIEVVASVSCTPSGACLAVARRTSGASELLARAGATGAFVPVASPIATALSVSCLSGAAPGAASSPPKPTCAVAGADAAGAGAIVTVVGTRVARELSLAYVPDPLLAVACATLTRCAGVTETSTVSFV